MLEGWRLSMGLIIERHSSDTIMKMSKIKVTVDKKKKFALSVGERIEIDIENGLHRIDCSLNLLKANIEINYPQDNHIVLSYRVSPSGINIQCVTSEDRNNYTSNESAIYNGSSSMNGSVGNLTITDTDIVFKEIGSEDKIISYYDIREVSSSLGNLAIELYNNKTFTFLLPKDNTSILDYVKNKVSVCFQELHQGFNLCFGIDVKVFINEEQETFYIQNGKWVSPIYKLEQLIAYNVNETAKKQNFVGDAAVGTLIDGSRGALFGALHAAQQGNKVEAINLNLTIKTDNDVITHSFDFSNSAFAMEKGNKKYTETMLQCTRLFAYMDDFNKKRSVKAPVVEELRPTDITDELRKYKALLDDGIIDDAEFKAKKKQLLGL